MQFYLKEEWRVPTLVGGLSFSVGAGVGYFICNRRWTKLGLEVVTTMEETTEFIETVTDEPSQLSMDFARAVEDSRNKTVEVRVTRPEAFDDNSPDVVEFNIVPEPERVDEWNQEEEETERSPDSPYVIHREEYYAGESGYNQSCLEYFATDGLLCDANRVPIYNPEKVVGRLEFGRGSGDSDVVYIRNESLKAEYEITRNHGSYQVEVLGIQIEEEFEEGDLRHSHSMPKFRMD